VSVEMGMCVAVNTGVLVWVSAGACVCLFMFFMRRLGDYVWLVCVCVCVSGRGCVGKCVWVDGCVYLSMDV